MPEYRWFTDHDSVRQDGTSCRCLVRRSHGSGLRIKYKSWRQMNMLFLSLVKRMDIGAGPLAVVGGSAPSGVNVNNNYDYDNENIGVAALRKFFYSSPLRLKNLSGGRTLSNRQSSSRFPGLSFELQDTADYRWYEYLLPTESTL